jgi:hypothetical protein
VGKLSALLAGLVPISFQFVGGAVFADRELLPMDLGRMERTRTLSEDLAAHRVQEIQFTARCSVVDLIELYKAWKKAPGSLSKSPSEGWSVRKLPLLPWSEEVPIADKPVLAATEIALALGQIEELMAANDASWSYFTAIAALRRIESATTRAPGAASVLIEKTPMAWSPARLLLSISIDLGRLLVCLEAPISVRRATLLALLCVGSRAYPDGPALSDSLVELPPALEPAIKAQLALVEQGLMSDTAFWAAWSAMTGRPIPSESNERILSLPKAASRGLTCLLGSPNSTPGPLRLRTVAQLNDLCQTAANYQLASSKLVVMVYSMMSMRSGDLSRRSRSWSLSKLHKRSKPSVELTFISRF